jgi:hypothetical protein
VSNFTYEDDIKIENKHVAGILRTFYLSTETISRPPQSRETIPLKQEWEKIKFKKVVFIKFKQTLIHQLPRRKEEVPWHLSLYKL